MTGTVARRRGAVIRVSPQTERVAYGHGAVARTHRSAGRAGTGAHHSAMMPPMVDDGASPDDGIVEILVGLGVGRPVAAEYVRRGDPEGAVFDSVLLPARTDRTVSPGQIASEGGLGVDEIAELMEAFGLPRPAAGEPVFTPAEAGVLIELGGLDELWPADVRIQVGRAYGAMLAGVARAELQAFLGHTQRHLREGEEDAAEQLRALKAAMERLLPLADPLLTGVHRRWIEHELGQRAVVAAEARAATDHLPGAVEVTFLFCDLKDFTAYAAEHGDGAAIGAIDRFFRAVDRERGDGGEFVKSLGDGALLVYRDPCEAVAAGLRIIVAMRGTGFPEVHASAHRGLAVARSGDYLGGAVNLAARLLALSGGGELVATDAVAGACPERFAWERGVSADVRGLSEPVAFSRLAPPP